MYATIWIKWNSNKHGLVLQIKMQKRNKESFAIPFVHLHKNISFLKLSRIEKSCTFMHYMYMKSALLSLIKLGKSQKQFIKQFSTTKESVCYKALENKGRLRDSLLVAVKMAVFVNNSKTIQVREKWYKKHIIWKLFCKFWYPLHFSSFKIDRVMAIFKTI